MQSNDAPAEFAGPRANTYRDTSNQSYGTIGHLTLIRPRAADRPWYGKVPLNQISLYYQ